MRGDGPQETDSNDGVALHAVERGSPGSVAGRKFASWCCAVESVVSLDETPKFAGEQRSVATVEAVKEGVFGAPRMAGANSRPYSGPIGPSLKSPGFGAEPY